MSGKTEWIYCPVCGNKTRLQIRLDTVLKNFPLYCPKCKQENLIDVKEFSKIFCECPQNRVKQRITPHFLTTDHPNYYEFTTKE